MRIRTIALFLLLSVPMTAYILAADKVSSGGSGFLTLETDHQQVWVSPATGGAVVRWTHRPTGIELLRGYQNRPLKGGSIGLWQECIIADGLPAKPEDPVAESYEVVHQSSNKLTMKATLDNGLVLTRQMRLYQDKAALEVEVSVQNPSDRPVVLPMKIRPEFYNQNHHEPAIWLDRGQKWQKFVTEKYCGNLSNGSLSPNGIRRWALEIPGTKLVLVNTFRAEELDSLYYWCRRPTQQANLELIPKKTPLAPGEIRTVHSTYEICDGLPAPVSDSGRQER